jgi:Domain of unknown function (DUF6134)
VTILRLVSLAAVLAGIVVLLCPPARAGETVYDYRIEHPRYGTIGTYRNVIKEDGGKAEVDTEIHVAVSLLGIVVYRQDGTRVEHWQGDRFVGIDGVTVTNGKRIEIHGQAKGDEFVVTTPTGTVVAPARVHPSNPWARMVLDSDMMMSTKTGHVEKVSVSGGRLEQIKLDGKEFRLHGYEIVGTKRQFVWLDDHDVPVAFRVEEDGTPIDFVMTRPPQTQAANAPPR